MHPHSAQLVEIFSSMQGEGLYVGEKMTFVRFGSCNMRCKYCDTPQGICIDDTFRVETQPGSGVFESAPNPVSATGLSEMLARFDDTFVSITGGEPLQQADFLAGFLPSLLPHKRVLLETNGVMHEELERVLPYVSVVSMDIKLPSATGVEPRWQDNAEFLRKTVVAGREVYVKLVVTEETNDGDLEHAICIVTRINKHIPIVIQPASRTLTFSHPITQRRLDAVERLVGAYLQDVRVIPQMHKQWGVL
jgi:organic radical activating enzyme